MTDPRTWEHLRELGVATVYEAAGREGLIDLPLLQAIPGSRAAGPARTAMCGQDDNLMAHAVIEHIQPGEVLVLAMPRPSPVALVGELLVRQAKWRGAAALLIDAAVRDVEDLASLGLPVWSRYVRVRGADKLAIGELNGTLEIGGASVRPGDAVILDPDGAVCVARERLDEVVEQARARRDREALLRRRLDSGELSLDIHGLRGLIEEQSA